ncbi:ubiquinone biosynthesis regulatory protein kinase UbiB [Haliea sp. E17]|uniref:ubiquinone biosynthesis regulatory protein kinase UbiB n=1 Tax=Haliea sp. E17 TaxID=3401576 RepID=UPI003AAF233F
MSRSLRLLTIFRVVGRYRLDLLLDHSNLPPLPRTAFKLAPWHLHPVPDMPRGERLRRALEELGPVFVKFGQMLSTRRDLLPEDIADELARLQDAVPPFPGEQAVAIIEKSLGQPVADLFASFDPEPMASASVAQVHAATLASGESVVVKVLRPDIEPVIRQDLALMFILARLVERFLPFGRRLRPVEVVKDYELVVLDELDLGREAANASQLRRNFEDSPLVYVPRVYWDYSAHNVFTMERIKGIPVTDVKTLKELDVDLKLLAERGVEIFFTQVLRDSFFHADMHPGNIFVDASNPADPTYIAVDCAIIGSLSDSDQYYLARNLLAIFHRDYREVAQLHVECGWVPADTRVQDFEAAMRAVCEPVFERPISEISFGQLLVYLFRTASRFDMEVQPSLVLLQKTLLNIEGLGRQLYPDLNLWDTAQPFLEQWMAERYSPQSMLQKLQRQAPSWLEQLPRVPDLVLHQLEHGTTERNPARGSRPSRPRTLSGRSAAGLAALAAAVVVARPQALDWLAEVPLASWALVAAGLALLWPRRS